MAPSPPACWAAMAELMSRPDPGDQAPDPEAIAAQILALLAERAAGKTICPSEVARRMCDDWRPLMAPVRAVAADLAEAGQVAVLQGGRKVDPATARGPIRLGRGVNWSEGL